VPASPGRNVITTMKQNDVTPGKPVLLSNHGTCSNTLPSSSVEQLLVTFHGHGVVVNNKTTNHFSFPCTEWNPKVGISWHPPTSRSTKWRITDTSQVDRQIPFITAAAASLLVCLGYRLLLLLVPPTTTPPTPRPFTLCLSVCLSVCLVSTEALPQFSSSWLMFIKDIP
jgi:hypothetical protein